MQLATVTLLVIGVYLAIGVIFGLVFAVRLVDRLDGAAKGAGPGFRALIVPGAAALWPLLLPRALRSRRTESTQ